MRYKIRFVWAITQMMLCNISFSSKTFFVALRPRPNKSIFRQLNKRDNTNHFNSFCRSKHCLDNWFGPFISWLVFIDSVSKQIINDYFFSMWSPHLVFWVFLSSSIWRKVCERNIFNLSQAVKQFRTIYRKIWHYKYVVFQTSYASCDCKCDGNEL